MSTLLRTIGERSASFLVGAIIMGFSVLFAMIWIMSKDFQYGPDHVEFRYVADDSTGDTLPVVLILNNREFLLIERNPKDYDTGKSQ